MPLDSLFDVVGRAQIADWALRNKIAEFAPMAKPARWRRSGSTSTTSGAPLLVLGRGSWAGVPSSRAFRHARLQVSTSYDG
jgi:hypothetical protein